MEEQIRAADEETLKKIWNEVRNMTVDFVCQPKFISMLDIMIQEYCGQAINILNDNKIDCDDKTLSYMLSEFVEQLLAKAFYNATCKVLPIKAEKTAPSVH